jgi:uncharacterized damage-inducible protein DinB
MATASPAPEVFLSPPALLEHWQGHRRLTRRVIEAFPEDKFASFAIGGMRPFAAMAGELLRMAVPTVRGVLSGEWKEGPKLQLGAKPEVLGAWDETTTELNALWSKIPSSRFRETMKAFGQWEMTGHGLVLYLVDNEIHHRGQGYVYLRALGIEPPAFWDRT